MDFQNVVQHFGYLAVVLLTMGKGIGLPLPGETVLLVVAAATGATGALNLGGVIIAGAVGTIAGNNFGYWLGRKGGRPVLQRILHFFRISPSHLVSAETFFDRHGGKAIFFSRFLAFTRMFASLLAGIARMRYPTFLIYSVSGSILWVVLICWVGHELGSNLSLIENWLHEAGWLLLSVAVVGLIGGYVLWQKQRLPSAGPSRGLSGICQTEVAGALKKLGEHIVPHPEIWFCSES